MHLEPIHEVIPEIVVGLDLGESHQSHYVDQVVERVIVFLSINKFTFGGVSLVQCFDAIGMVD